MFGAGTTLAQEREQALYRLITLSASLASLHVEVRRVEASLEGLSRSDDDLACLYLSGRPRAEYTPSSRASLRHDVALLLEGYVAQYIDVLDRIEALQGRVEAQRTLEGTKLHNERNHMMRSELRIAISSLSLAVSSVIGGFFGMNLSSGLEAQPSLLWLVAVGGMGASATLFLSLTRGLRRFHETQRASLVQTGRLQRSLGSFDYAFYALRRAQGVEADREAAERSRAGRGGRRRPNSAASGGVVPTSTWRTEILENGAGGTRIVGGKFRAKRS